MTEEVLASKKNLGLGWEEISTEVALGSVFLTSACLGKNSLKKEYADKLCTILKLENEVSIALQEYPHKTWDFTVS